MEILDEISDKTFGIKTGKDVKYRIRRTARGLIFNGKGEIAMMYSKRFSYHKLPGGGMEGDENFETALKREAMEEAGARIKLVKPVGMIIESRAKLKTLQISYCFICKLSTEKLGERKLTASEKYEGFRLKWVKLNEAIRLVNSDSTNFYEGKFISKREITFLLRARELMRQNKG